MANRAYSARNSRINFAGTNLLGLKWTINVKVDALDVSNFESQGYVDYIGGLWEADISFDAIIKDTGNVAFSSMYPGLITSTTSYFYMDAGTAVNVATGVVEASATGSTVRFAFPKLFIESINFEGEVRGFHRMSVTCKNAGVFTLPSLA